MYFAARRLPEMRLRPHPGTSVLTCKGGCNDGIDHGRCRCCRRGGCARPRSAHPPFQLRPAASAIEMKHLTIRNAGKAVTIGTRIVPADTFLSRLFGLLGKTRLEPGCGLLIRPSSGVHTMGMLFPIDVVALDKAMRVVKVWRRLRPFRVTSVSFKISSVLELPAGQIETCQIERGDLLEIVGS